MGARAREQRAEGKAGGKGDPEMGKPRASGPRDRAGGADDADAIERPANGEARSDVRLIHARERSRSNGPKPGEARSDDPPFWSGVEGKRRLAFSRELRVVNRIHLS